MRGGIEEGMYVRIEIGDGLQLKEINGGGGRKSRFIGFCKDREREMEISDG
jgi:hypothetical protein